MFPLVVDSWSTCTCLVPTSPVSGPLQLLVRRSDCLISSKAVLGGGGTPSCVSKSKWILQREGVA